MAQHWIVTEPFRDTAAGAAFSSLEKSFHSQGEIITDCPISQVIKAQVADRYYYVKRYTRGGKHLRRYMGRSRIRAEWENLLYFSSLEIPVPPVVAYGEKTAFGVCQQGVLITEELQDSVDLAALEQQQHPVLNDRHWCETVLLQVANYTQRLHEQGFVHGDLKWRNILVQDFSSPKVFFIDCPIGRKRFGYFYKHGRVKDLACLDRLARQCLTHTQRLSFLLAYFGKARLDQEAKAFIRAIDTYLLRKDKRA